MANFQESNPGWQLHKFRQQLSEGIEVFFRDQNEAAPDWKVPEWIGQVFNFLAWVLLIAFCSWLGLQGYRGLRKYWLERRGIVEGSASPLAVNTPPSSFWWQQAQMFYHEGNYREACRSLYLGLLQILHDREILRQKPSLTDGEYRQLLGIQSLSQMQSYFTLINLHERLFFSSMVISQNHFLECQEAYDRIAGETQKT